MKKNLVKSLSERLQLRDFDSNLAYDGEQAIQLVTDEVPDVMVLDLKMPGIDGMEVLRRVKKKFPGVQVIILTGHGSEKDEIEARKLGAFEYLQKPTDLDTLVGTLKRAYRAKFEKTMAAAAFAEAGEFDMAKDMANEKKKK